MTTADALSEIHSIAFADHKAIGDVWDVYRVDADGFMATAELPVTGSPRLVSVSIGSGVCPATAGQVATLIATLSEVPG